MSKNQQHTIKPSTQQASTVSPDIQLSAAAQQAITDALAPITDLVQLSPEARSQVAKPKTSWQQGVVFMIEVLIKHPELVPGRISPQQMEQSAAKVAALRLLQATLEAGLQQVKDTILVTSSAAWLDALAVYASAESSAKTNQDVAVLIAPFAALLVQKRKPKDPSKKKAPKAPASTAGTPAPTSGPAPTDPTAGSGPVPTSTTSTGVPVYTPTPKS